jgi:hypothetical protein
VRDATFRTDRMPRKEVVSVERHSYWINVYDEINRRRLRIRPFYTFGEIEELANALDVQFGDHVKGHGLRGRLFG